MQHTNGILYGDTSLGGTGNVSPCITGLCGVLYSLNSGLKPFASLLPSPGKVGESIGILGQGFAGTTSVSFNGTPAAYEVSMDTFLKATVPPGATSGFVRVTAPNGTLRSNRKFQVRP